jgi:predicted AlkP superfamily phosphohydrolase/phosphomutase
MRARGARDLRVAFLAAMLALLGGCDVAEAPTPAAARLVVIGFDGMDPNLLERWMDAGDLPEFSRLRQDGHYQRLGTSNPPQSPVAWASFATGTGAGEHGIFDFLRRDPSTYRPDFSIARYTPPERTLDLLGWQLPLGEGRLENQRQGTPFWLEVERDGRRATVQRVPVTYPPDPIHHMISGMGVPDLAGAQGTYTLFSTRRLAAAESGGRIVLMRMGEDGRANAALEGPAHPLQPGAAALSLDLSFTFRSDGASIRIGEETRELAVGEWSSWWPLRFSYGLGSIPGMVRMRLVEGFPRPLLYVSPIHADPFEPALPLSAPPEYSAELAARIGRFHTLGMPEETWSLNQDHLDEAGFLDMVKTTLAEGEAMLHDALGRRDSELVVHVFVQPDRVSHMFWRGLDPEHPLHAESSELARGAIPWIYRESDRVLGEIRKKLAPQDRLIVLSDHGFASFRRAAHVNRWLIERGYLSLVAGARETAPMFAEVDWSRSRAYALGLNGLFVNQHGREAQGIVSADARDALLQEIAQGLAQWQDDDGTPVVRRTFRGSDLYPGPRAQDAPDLVLGYAAGYRASWQTSLGAAPMQLIEDNRQAWSGDHCIDPELVPGILLTSFTPDRDIADIAAMAHLVLHHTPAKAPTP